MKMIEKVVWAIDGEPSKIDILEQRKLEASAAIEALMEPSENILPRDLHSEWQATLRAILDEKP